MKRIRSLLYALGAIICVLSVFFLLCVQLMHDRGYYGVGSEIIVPICGLSYIIYKYLDITYNKEDE